MSDKFTRTPRHFGEIQTHAIFRREFYHVYFCQILQQDCFALVIAIVIVIVKSGTTEQAVQEKGCTG
jgi:hypothetical protein